MLRIFSDNIEQKNKNIHEIASLLFFLLYKNKKAKDTR